MAKRTNGTGYGASQELRRELGKRIREARKARSMTLAELGGDQLSRSFLNLVELGRSSISLQSLSKVASRLDLPLSYFVEALPSSDSLPAAEGDTLLLLRAALDRARASEHDLILEANLAACLGRLYVVRGEFDNAIDQYSRARTLLEAAASVEHLIGVHADLGRSYEQKRHSSPSAQS